MTRLTFKPLGPPFRRWLGPYSPSRGRYDGFRVRYGALGAWVSDGATREFRTLVDGAAARALAEVVVDHWGGGRVLLLPDGKVVKPLNDTALRGQRALVGVLSGPVILDGDEGEPLDLLEPDFAVPGARWQGPTTIGVECVLGQGGSLECSWYHPTHLGRDYTTRQLTGPSSALRAGFQKARPRDSAGRVRVTVNGHVITNEQTSANGWTSKYVGRIDPESWPHDPTWIGGIL